MGLGLSANFLFLRTSMMEYFILIAIGFTGEGLALQEPLCGLNLLTYSAECYTEVKRLPDKPTNQVYQYWRIFKQQNMFSL